MPCASLDAKAHRCLQALLLEMRAEDELILVLDGSVTDEVLDERIQVHSLARRQGPAAARNFGASLAHGDVLLFVDADVVVHPGTGDQVRTFFSEDRGEALFGSYDDAPWEPDFISQFRNLQHHYVHCTNAGSAHTFWAGCGAIKRTAFAQVGGFDESFQRPAVEDIELGMRLSHAGHRIILDPSLQSKHLKRWSLLPMWRNDLLCRALPWSRLILNSGQMPSGLNTDGRARIAVAAQALAVLCLALSPFLPGLLWGVLALEMTVAICHAPFLGFLARKRGLPMAVLSVPLIWMYVLISGLGFAMAQVERWLTSKRGEPPVSAVAMEADVS